MEKNPYYQAAEISAEAFLRHGPTRFYNYSGFSKWEDDTDWLLRDLVDGVHCMAWAISDAGSSLHRDARLQKATLELFDSILARNVNGVWWQGDDRRGDPNTNLFIFYPFIEAFLLLRPSLSKAQVDRVLGMIEPFMAKMRELYPPVTPAFRQYPNMDAQFALSAQLAAKVSGRSVYADWADEYARHVCRSTLGGGAFTYIHGTNDCEVYHQIVVVMLVRYWELTHDERVLACLRKTVPYYPNAVEPCGIADDWTDPHWKHYWASPAMPYAPVMIATLFPDEPLAAQNRWIAHRLAKIFLRDLEAKAKDARSRIINFRAYAAYAAPYWRDDAGQKPRDRVILDGAIRGPRQRCGDFSWAATGGEFSDTFIGAMVGHDDATYSAVQAAGAEARMKASWCPEDQHRWAQCAYLSEKKYPSATLVRDDCAAFAAASELYPCSVPWNTKLIEEKFKPSGWQTRQVWLGTRYGICGLICLAPTPAAREAISTGIYVRLGGLAKEIVQKEAGHFVAADLDVRVLDHSPATTKLQPGKTCYMYKDFHSTEIVLVPAADWNWLENGLWAVFSITRKGTQPFELNQAWHDAKTVIGMDITLGGEVHRVLASPKGIEMPRHNLLRTERDGLKLTWSCRRESLR